MCHCKFFHLMGMNVFPDFAQAKEQSPDLTNHPTKWISVVLFRDLWSKTMNLRMIMIKNTNKMQPQIYFEAYWDYFKPKTLSIITRLCAQRNCAAQISVRCRVPRVRPSACSPVLLLLVHIWDALPGLHAGVETVTLASPQHIPDSRKICVS